MIIHALRRGFITILLIGGTLSLHLHAQEDYLMKTSPGVQIVPPASNVQNSLLDVLTLATKENDAPTVLVALKLMADDAVSKDNATFKSYDLCGIEIAGTNLFCQVNKNIDRLDMPQFIGKPVLGSWAALNLTPNAKGEVNATDTFISWIQEQPLNKSGQKITINAPETVSASTLKATQRELEGKKVAGMWWALEQDPKNPAITAPIFISKDNYIIDGHHRWAAIVGTAFKHRKLNEVTMQVRRINAPINKIVNNIPGDGGLANKFVKEFGIMQENAGKPPTT
jgi:hypothetical protein